MFGSLILPTGVTGGGIHHHHHHHHLHPRRSPRDNLSAMGFTPYHPTMSFHSRQLPKTRIRASSSSSSFTAPSDTLPRVEPNTTTLNLYQILRIKQNASSLEIKSAYRKLAKQFHPDALPPPPTSSSDDDGAGLDFMAIHNAYATLSDPTERARYDLSMIQIQSTNSSSSSHTRFHTYSSSSSASVDGNENRRRSYGMQTRRWETDQCW